MDNLLFVKKIVTFDSLLFSDHDEYKLFFETINLIILRHVKIFQRRTQAKIDVNPIQSHPRKWDLAALPEYFLNQIDEYYKTKTEGIYHCIVCNLPLFSSEAKYDSGCGWPAFTDELE